MKAIPYQYINFVTSEEEKHPSEWMEFRKQVKQHLNDEQRLVLSVLNFIQKDQNPYDDLTEQYDKVKETITSLNQEALAYLDKLLNKYNLRRDYL